MYCQEIKFFKIIYTDKDILCLLCVIHQMWICFLLYSRNCMITEYWKYLANEQGRWFFFVLPRYSVLYFLHVACECVYMCVYLTLGNPKHLLWAFKHCWSHTENKIYKDIFARHKYTVPLGKKSKNIHQ